MTKEIRIPLTDLAEEEFKKGYKSFDSKVSDQITFKDFNRKEFDFILRNNNELQVITDIAKGNWKSFEKLIAKPITQRYVDEYGDLESLKGSEMYFDHGTEQQEAHEYYSEISNSIFNGEKNKNRQAEKLLKYRVWLHNFKLAKKIEWSIQSQIYDSELAADFVNKETGLLASFKEIKSLLLDGKYKFVFDEVEKEFVVKPEGEQYVFWDKMYVAYVGKEDETEVEDGEPKLSKKSKGKELLTLSYNGSKLFINDWVIHQPGSGSIPHKFLEFMIENPNRICQVEELIHRRVFKTSYAFANKDPDGSEAQKFSTLLGTLKLVGKGKYFRVGSLFFHRIGDRGIKLRNPICESHIIQYNEKDNKKHHEYNKRGFKDDKITYKNKKDLLNELKKTL